MEAKHIVALSGGKDSTALALRLRELNPTTPYQFVITPTGNELPEMEAHWQRLEDLLETQITRLNRYEGDGLAAVIKQEGMIPNFRARFCTRILKIEPMIAYLKSQSPCYQYVGLRADEPTRIGIYGEYPGITQVFPLQDWEWGIDEVWAYLDHKHVSIPQRTDCALCFFQRLGEWKQLLDEHPHLYQVGVDLEAEANHTFRSPSRDKWPAGLAELRDEFNSGRKLRRFTSRNGNCEQDALCRVCSM